MKITRGPMLEKFANAFEVEIDEVVEWVNAYVNRPEEFKHAETTEKERFESIKKYISWRLDNTSEARIRASIAAEKREAA